MNLTERDIDLIDDYIRGNLTAENERELKSKLQDKRFKEELEYRRDIRIAANAVVRENRKSLLQEEETSISSNEDKGSQPKPGGRWIGLLIIAILLTIIYFAFKNQGDKPKDNQTLFAQFYEPYPNVINPIQMGSKNEVIDPFQLYEERKYEDAIAAFETTSESTESSKFYQGLSYLFIGDIKSSKSILTEIIQNPSHRHYQGAEWYLSGIYLKENQKEDALRLLKKMSQDHQHPYQNQASNVLKKI